MEEEKEVEWSFGADNEEGGGSWGRRRRGGRIFLNRPVYSSSKQSQTAIADFAVKKVDEAAQYTGATAG